MAFHLKPGGPNRTAKQNKNDKKKLVLTNRAHAALVYDGPDVVGWCQFGSPAELPARMSAYSRLGVGLPDWRITCFFVDRDRRKEGIAKAALAGALRMIAARGGGMVDAYPSDLRGKSTSSSFLWSGTASMFDDAGFRLVAHLGTTKVVMRKVVRPRRGGLPRARREVD